MDAWRFGQTPSTPVCGSRLHRLHREYKERRKQRKRLRRGLNWAEAPSALGTENLLGQRPTQNNKHLLMQAQLLPAKIRKAAAEDVCRRRGTAGAETGRGVAIRGQPSEKWGFSYF